MSVAVPKNQSRPFAVEVALRKWMRAGQHLLERPVGHELLLGQDRNTGTQVAQGMQIVGDHDDGEPELLVQPGEKQLVAYGPFEQV
ncbi:MAG: hypothetical protein H6R26_3612, partial [Proteobacteria bacterium]|nr:hypothetical protein [Pseudomonadota bacterium]